VWHGQEQLPRAALLAMRHYFRHASTTDRSRAMKIRAVQRQIELYQRAIRK
jgi:hypothetical protein